jgi:hypothetical protein
MGREEFAPPKIFPILRTHDHGVSLHVASLSLSLSLSLQRKPPICNVCMYMRMRGLLKNSSSRAEAREEQIIYEAGNIL